MGIDVIGARFGRTGTLSLKSALERLGFAPCYHMYELLGVMNVAGLVAVALVVFAEKALPHGRGIGLLAAVGMIILGVAVAVHPSLLPTVA